MKHNEKVYEYDAFISYRHIPRDMHIAEMLHKALETYRTPTYLVKRGVVARLKKVFRDKEELPTSSNLGQDIEDALIASKYLIVICSPEAVQSQWVLREVEFFGEYHGYDKILTLLVDGEPKDAFPPSLIRYQGDERDALTNVIEPLAADIRENAGISPLKQLKTEKLRLIAAILGCKYDELRQREQERKVKRIITIAVSVTTFLLAFSAFTVWQLNEVNRARETAVYNEKLVQEAQSRIYSSIAKKAADSGDLLLGMSMAVEALPGDLKNPDKPLIQDAKDALYYTAVQYGMQERTYLYPPAATSNDISKWCFFEENGDIITVGERVIRQFSHTTGRLSHEWMTANGYEILAVSPGADKAVIAGYQSGKLLDVQLWDILQNRVITKQAFSLGDKVESIQYWYDANGFDGLIEAGFEPNGERFYIACNEYYKGDANYRSKIYLFDSHSGKALDLPQRSFDYLFGDVLISNGHLVVGVLKPDWNDGQDIYVYDIEKKALKYQSSVDDRVLIDSESQYRGLGITSNGKKLVYISFVSSDSVLQIIDMETGGHQEIITDECAISNDGNMAAFFWMNEETKINQFMVLDLIQNKPIAVVQGTPSFDIPEIQPFFFCSNDRYILFDNSEMLDIQNTHLYTLDLKNRRYADSDASGKYLAHLDQYGTGVVFQLMDPQVHETVVSTKNLAAVRDGGVLLFEDQYGGGTVIRKWDTKLKVTSITDYEESDVASLCNIDGGAVGFMGSQKNFDIFSIDTGRTVSTFRIDGQFHDFQVDPTGKYVLVSKHGINTEDGVYLMDAQTGLQIRQLSTSDINGSQNSSMRCVGFFPGGKYCWSAEYHEPETENTGIVIFDVETGRAVNCIHMRENFSDFSASLSSDGSRMVVQPLRTLQLWTIDNQMSPAFMCDLQGDFLCMDDSVVVTWNSDINMLYIYELKTGLQKATIRSTSASVSKGVLTNGGQQLLTISDSSESGPIRMMLWDLNTGKAVANLYKDYSKDTVILDFGLINDGKEIAIVSEYYGKTYIRAIPFLSSFDRVYDSALEKLSDRRFDEEKDLDHIQ